jgi:mRNA interferase HicA
MKRKDLIKYLIDNGCELEREGRKHTVFYNPMTNRSSTIPRHREIYTFTAKAICRDLGIPIIEIK